MTGASTPMMDSTGEAPVPNVLVDIAFACAAHAEHTHSQRESANQSDLNFTQIDDGMFVAGQLAPSAAVLEEVQVRRRACRRACRARMPARMPCAWRWCTETDMPPGWPLVSSAGA